jgi:hypothetical protein
VPVLRPIRSVLSGWAVALLLACGCTDRGVIGSVCPHGQCEAITVDSSTPAPTLDAPVASSDAPQLSDAALEAGPTSDTGLAVACRVRALTLEQKSLSVHLLIDKTVGVLAWWTPLIEAFGQFVAQPQSAGVNLGLTFFGGACDINYSTPSVPLAALPGNNMALLAAFPATPVELDKALLSAFRGSLAYAHGWALQTPETKTVVLLITEDLDQDCGTTQRAMIEAATSSFEDKLSVATYIVALGAEDYDSIAQAGGTGKAQHVDATDTPTLLQALTAVRDAAKPLAEPSCKFQLPSAERPERAQLRLIMQDSSELSVAAVPDHAACTTASGGFYYDDRTAPALVVCEQSCDKLRSAARVELLDQCP